MVSFKPDNRWTWGSAGFFVYRNSERDRDWIDASNSSGLLSFFLICWSFLDRVLPLPPKIVLWHVSLRYLDCAVPPPEVAGQYRQLSVTIDQQWQGSCHWTGEAQPACPLLLSTPCYLRPSLYLWLVPLDFCVIFFCFYLFGLEARRFTVGWGTALRTRRSRFRFPMVSLEFFIDIILQTALWDWSRLSL